MLFISKSLILEEVKHECDCSKILIVDDEPFNILVLKAMIDKF